MSFDPENIFRFKPDEVHENADCVLASDYDQLLELYRASQRAVAHGLETME